jgi:tetratricopeptide (TPR) repeat protein
MALNFSARLLIAATLYALSSNANANANAQQVAPWSIVLISRSGPGGILIPRNPDWKPELINVYDHGTRPVLQMSNASTKVTASFILFENISGQPNAQGCRKDAIDPILKNQGKLISDHVDSESKNRRDDLLAITSYMTAIGDTKAKQHSVFAFAGDRKTCAEIHVSVMAGTPDEESNLKAAIAEFYPLLDYQPSAQDYFGMATLLFQNAPALAAPYYKSALDNLPPGPQSLNLRRVITDQLVMSLGMTGDIKSSRAIAQQATQSDPDYPFNYYNLACADAEEGKAADAKLHLQQAFNRKANTIPGEHLPDPTQDDSILKLKKDKEFWAFVQTLK